MNIQERGDALLTAYVNKDFETVMGLWNELANSEPYDRESLIALHCYENQSITDTKIGIAVAKAVKLLIK